MSTYFSNNITILNSSIDTNLCKLDSICHKTTKYYYDLTKQKIEQLTNISSITSERPSGLNTTLTPNFEIEFSDLSNNKTFGGMIYYIFNNKLMIDMDKMNELQKILNNYISSNNLQNDLNNAYSNIVKFDKTISSAASIMLTNFLTDKKIILNFYNFMFLFISFVYFIVWICVFVFVIIYECKKYKCIFYFLIAFMNVMVVMTIWEIVLSALFQGIRLFIRESPRVMKFVFTEDYILNGNTENYPPKFGDKDETQIELFSICLNGDGDLLQKFVSKETLNTILSQTESMKINSNDIYNIIKNDLESANIENNPYYTLFNYSSIYSSIVKLEEMYNNLYIVSGNFKDDDIRNIINNIRTNLDSSSCGMIYEYFVIKKSDCPRYSIILNHIQVSTDYVYHCYIIQDLLSTTKATYSGSGCDNDYINKAITFIKEISSILKNRINKLKEIQKNFALTWNNMNSEITLINNNLNNIEFTLKNEINNKYSIANCSSVKFDLFDFSDFMSEKIGYKAKIMISFSAIGGMLGFILLYSLLLIINEIKYQDKNVMNNNNQYFNYNYSRINTNKRNKYRNIKPPTLIKSNSEIDEENDYINNNKILGIRNKNDNNNNSSNDVPKDINEMDNKKPEVIYNNIRKIEMRYMGNKENNNK